MEQFQRCEKMNTLHQQKEHLENTSCKKSFQFSFAETEELDRMLRKPRSRFYMDAVDAIDLLSVEDEEIIERLLESMDEETAEEFSEMSTEELLEEIKASFQEEFESLPIEIESVLYGVLAKCRIEGCDCHVISTEGKIIDHFKEQQALPTELEKGRILLGRYPQCKCVEVYSDCCRIISKDSSVQKVPNHEI